MSNTAPQGWGKGVFVDVVKIDYGKSPKDIFNKNGSYPVIGTGGVTGFTNSYLHDGNTTVIGRKGTINSPSFVATKFWAIDTTYFVSEHKNADAKWFYYLIQNIDLTKFNEASGVPSLNRDTLYSIPCIFPPLLEQEKIASILTAVDEVIESTQAQINKLKDLKNGMMQELLTKGIGHTEFKDSPVGRIPKAWKVVELEKLCTWMGVGIATSTTHAYTEDGVPLLRNQNIFAGTIDKTDILKITKEFSEENNSKKIKTGDVVTIRTGYPGKSAVVTKEFHDCHTFTTLISRPDANLIDSEFLALIINSDYGMSFVAGGQAGGAQQNLNVSILKIFPVKLPDLIEQRKIFSLVSSVTHKIEVIEKKYEQFQKAKKALMQDLLTGKVRVKVN